MTLWKTVKICREKYNNCIDLFNDLSLRYAMIKSVKGYEINDRKDLHDMCVDCIGGMLVLLLVLL